MRKVIIGSEEPHLICPCGSEYLNQVRYDIDAGGVQISQCATSASSQTEPTPKEHEKSGPRQSIRIVFDCEECDLQPVLIILQYKGVTFFDWVYSEERLAEVRG